jgi:subtilisin family serine protease
LQAADAASCDSFTLARALAAALEARVQIVNLSLSGPADPLLAALIQEGARRGILFVGAASGLMDQHGVIEVTSSDARVSEEAVLHAPGREILTLMPGGRYDFATGDSVSTAQVTGVVALMLARDRSLTAGAAFQLLHATSAEAGDGSHGTVDACAALAALLGQGTCRETAQNGPGDTHDHPGAIH